MRGAILISILFGTSLLTPQARASEPHLLCERAAARAERQFSIPSGLLQAIAVVETGHTRQGVAAAWPWTVNVNGEGRYFQTRAQAESFVTRKKLRGHASIDIGCFQINTKWHGDAFASPADMFDPTGGAAYAASFLSRLHGELGDWNAAARSYHSREQEKGARYGEKIAAVMKGFDQAKNEISRPGAFRIASPAPAERLKPGGVALTVFFASPPIVERGAAAPLWGGAE